MNRETRNDLRKRAYHRLVARTLGSSPEILEEAQAVVQRWTHEPIRPRVFDDWATLLARPIEEVRREITRRTPESNRLRIDSPFYLTSTPVVSDAARRRLGEIASRLASAR